MPRASGVIAIFECITCECEWKRVWWRGTEDSSAVLDDWNGRELRDLQSHTDCTFPHMRLKQLGSGYSGSFQQVRESQRAVLYQFADGSWAQPGSNDPNDEVAVKSVRDGGIRREFYHVRDMHDFNREQRAQGRGELSGYNDTVDLDESSRRDRGYESQDMALMHERDRNLRMALEMIGGAGSQGRYEKLRREYENRR